MPRGGRTHGTSREVERLIIFLYGDGNSVSKTAVKCDVSRSTVERVLKRNGVALRARSAALFLFNMRYPQKRFERFLG